MNNVESDVNRGICNSNEYPKLYNINNLTVTNTDASFDKMVIRFKLRYERISFMDIDGYLDRIFYGNGFKALQSVKASNRSKTKVTAKFKKSYNGVECMLANTFVSFIQDRNARYVTCIVELIINPTRFLAVHYSDRPSELTIENLAALPVDNNLFLYTPQTNETLNSSDNFLNDELYNVTRGHFPQYTSIIVAKAIEWLDNLFTDNSTVPTLAQVDDIREYIIGGQSFDLQLVPGRQGEEISISSIETYFEYKTASNNAVYHVHYLTPLINAMVDDWSFVDYEFSQEFLQRMRNSERFSLCARNTSNAAYPTSHNCGETAGKARCIKVNISGQTKILKIYAKTFDRIRFEVAFTTNVKQFCHAEGMNNFSQFSQFLNMIAREGVSRTNQVTSKISIYGNIPAIDDGVTAFELLTELTAKLSAIFIPVKPSPEEFTSGMQKINQVIQILLTQNRITETDYSFISKKLIKKMVEVNIIIEPQKMTAKNTTGFKSYPLYQRYLAFSQKMLSIINV